MREFLKGLDLDKETIDTIMAEHGKYITELKENNSKLEDEVKGYKDQITELSSKADDNSKVREELETLKNTIAEADKKKQEEIKNQNLLNNINAVLGDKKFTSKYARDGFVNDIKNELAKPENEGKGISEIVDYLSKDQTGIFESPNKAQDMPGVDNVDTDVSKEDFNKMGYKERLQLKNDNPELFAKLNN